MRSYVSIRDEKKYLISGGFKLVLASLMILMLMQDAE